MVSDFHPGELVCISVNPRLLLQYAIDPRMYADESLPFI